MADWTTPELARVWLRLDAADTDQTGLDGAVAAANALATRYTGPAPDGDLPADTVQGATMLAARLYRRRNSPEGVQAFTADTALYVAREDPDVARLLRIGPFTPPMVG